MEGKEDFTPTSSGEENYKQFMEICKLFNDFCDNCPEDLREYVGFLQILFKLQGSEEVWGYDTYQVDSLGYYLSRLADDPEKMERCLKECKQWGYIERLVESNLQTLWKRAQQISSEKQLGVMDLLERFKTSVCSVEDQELTGIFSRLVKISEHLIDTKPADLDNDIAVEYNDYINSIFDDIGLYHRLFLASNYFHTSINSIRGYLNGKLEAKTE